MTAQRIERTRRSSRGTAGRFGSAVKVAIMVAMAVAVVVTLLSLAACGSDAGAEPTREYTFHIEAVENGDQYDYVAKDPIDLRVGDRVTFEMVNNGALIHDLVVVHPDGQTIATADAVATGATLSLTVDFVEPGFYRLNCNVDNHLTEHGMQAIVEVLNADGSSA
jgi:plastocyanin